MIKALQRSSLNFWLDEKASGKELGVLVLANYGLFAWALVISRTPGDLTQWTSALLIGALGSTFPLAATPFVMVLGYRRASADIAFKFARTLAICWFLSLLLFAHNGIELISFTMGGWRDLFTDHLELKYVNPALAFIYSLISVSLMAIWTRSKVQDANSQAAAVAEDEPATNIALKRSSSVAWFLVFLAVNTFMLYAFVLDEQTSEALAKHLKGSSE
tara:strand:+ start:3892 stop:4545 length:654 start_codon:yes stop_codon:yes gene_type:complete